MRKIYELINNQIAFVLFLTLFLMFLTHIVAYNASKVIKASNNHEKTIYSENISTEFLSASPSTLKK